MKTKMLAKNSTQRKDEMLLLHAYFFLFIYLMLLLGVDTLS
jgi:hypothetical protein